VPGGNIPEIKTDQVKVTRSLGRIARLHNRLHGFPVCLPATWVDPSSSRGDAARSTKSYSILFYGYRYRYRYVDRRLYWVEQSFVVNERIDDQTVPIPSKFNNGRPRPPLLCHSPVPIFPLTCFRASNYRARGENFEAVRPSSGATASIHLFSVSFSLIHILKRKSVVALSSFLYR
jgi:hypothetical protein